MTKQKRRESNPFFYLVQTRVIKHATTIKLGRLQLLEKLKLFLTEFEAEWCWFSKSVGASVK